MMHITWESAKVKISDLKEYENNPRRISKADFERLVNDLKQDGYHRRILVNQDNTIIGGHSRKKALLAAGFKNTDEIEVLKAKELLVENDLKRLNIRDNLPFGEFDFDMLANHFDPLELIEWGMPEEWLPDHVPEVLEGDDDVEAIDTNKPAITVLGDVWLLGSHRLMCGDSTSIDGIDKLMAREKADMVFIDPPYNTGMSAKNNSGSTRLSHMFNDTFTDEQWESFMASLVSNCWMLMKEDSAAYICLDWRRNHQLVPHITKHFHRSNMIIWDKMVHGLGSDYKYTYEIINVCKKGRPELKTNQGDDSEYSDVWHIQRKMGRDEEHATKKPIELVARAIRHASKQGELVVDIFGGSGSTLIASQQLGRNCYMMELSPHYCDIIVARWEKLTGQKAELEEKQ